MTFWLALASMLLVSATANAQCIEARNPSTGQIVTLCGGDAIPRPRECDSHGCYFDDLKRWRGQHSNLGSDLQRELERRAEEARKKFEADRKRSD